MLFDSPVEIMADNPAEGRAAVTGIDADRFMFKVPTLRNVELTYPYFHDGAVWTLEEAVDLMGRLQLGRSFKPHQNARIVAFLKTLTGRQPTFQIPVLPPSSNSTPMPKPFQKPGRIHRPVRKRGTDAQFLKR